MPHGDELAEEWECFRTSATNATHCVRLPAMEPSWSLRAEGTDGFTTDQLECRDLETKEAMGTQPPPPPPPPRLPPPPLLLLDGFPGLLSRVISLQDRRW